MASNLLAIASNLIGNLLLFLTLKSNQLKERLDGRGQLWIK